MRFRFNHRAVKIWKEKLFNKKMLPLWLCFAGAVCVFVLVASMGSNSKPVSPEDTAFYDKNRILVGMVADIPGFSQTQEDGSIAGFNCDLIQEILQGIYPEKPVEFAAIDSQMASYNVKNGENELAMGAFTANVTKTQGLSLSSVYFHDGVYAYVAPDSGIKSLAELNGAQILIMSTEVDAGAVEKALSGLGLSVTADDISSYLDAAAAVQSGAYRAVICPSYVFDAHNDGLVKVAEKVMDVGYRILAWTDNADAMTLINRQIAALREDGTLERLKNRWGLVEQAVEEE